MSGFKISGGSSNSGNITPVKAPKGVTTGDVQGSLVKSGQMSEVSGPEVLGPKIDAALEKHMYVTFGAAWKAVRGACTAEDGSSYKDKAFLRGESAKVVADLFESVRPGSSAILCADTGEYSPMAPVEKHYKFLAEKGYKVVPPMRGKKGAGNGVSL